MPILRCAILFGAILLQAVAQEVPKTAWELLLPLDRDGDGRVSFEEHARGEQRFRRLDFDGDGFITAKDVEQLRKDAGATRRRVATALGAALDLGPDATLDAAGLERWFAGALGRAKRGLEASDLAAVPERRREEFVAALDQDEDEHVSLAELRRAFALADLDENGVLTALEVGRVKPEERGRAGRPGDGAPQPGQQAPDLTLPTLDGTERRTLSTLWKERPVALIFGSFT